MQASKFGGLSTFLISSGLSIVSVGLLFPSIGQMGNRARQSEAKFALGAIYAAQQAYHQKHGRYASDFSQLGYSPSGATFNYHHGFSSKCDPQSSSMNTMRLVSPGFAESPLLKAVKTEAVAFLEALPCPTDATFVVGAAGTMEGRTLDAWTIDEKKVLENRVSGQTYAGSSGFLFRFGFFLLLGIWLLPIAVFVWLRKTKRSYAFTSVVSLHIAFWVFVYALKSVF